MDAGSYIWYLGQIKDYRLTTDAGSYIWYLRGQIKQGLQAHYGCRKLYLVPEGSDKARITGSLWMQEVISGTWVR